METALIVLTLFLSAFFSGIEIAFVSANKLKIELNRQKGTIAGKILAKFTQSPSHFLGTTLIGNNIALVLFNILATKAIEPYLVKLMPVLATNELLSLLLQTLIFTLLILITGEFLPKAIFRSKPNVLVRFFAIPFNVFYWTLKPIVHFTVWLSKFFLVKIFRIDFEEEEPVFSRYDLQHLVSLVQNDDENPNEIDAELFENALDLAQLKIRECMVPRTEIEAIEVNATIDELKQSILNSSHSKILVYEDSLDHIKGYVHHYDLWKKPKSIQAILMPITVVPEAMAARDLLNQLIKERRSIAHVVDEFGGTAGIVTLEDIVEEIFGEIEDEHDVLELVEKQLSSNEYIFSGRIEIDYINDKYHLGIPGGEYETLSGFVMNETQSIPEMNEVVYAKNYECHMLFVSETRIETIKLIVHPLVDV